MRGLILCLGALALVLLLTPQVQAGPLLERLGFGSPCANGTCVVKVEVKAAVVKPPAAAVEEEEVAGRGRVRAFFGRVLRRR